MHKINKPNLRAISRIAVVLIILAIVIVGGVVAYIYLYRAPTQAPAAEKLLRVSFANVPYLDPAVGSDEASTVYLVNVYDTLVYPLANNTLVPNVAKSWEVSPDGLTWTFHLRNDVKFHSGRSLTAYDVDFSLRRLITMGEGYAYLLKPYVDLDKTKVIDNTTIQIVLSKPFGPFLYALLRLYIVDSELVKANIKKPGPYGDMGDYGRDWLMSGVADAGSGPYKLAEYKRGESVTLVKFDKYWGQYAPNAPDKVVMLGTTEPSTIRTLIANRELEITDQWQPLENLEAMSKIKGVELSKLAVPYEFYLMINNKKPPTDDIHVRKAMALAFDYDSAISDINPYEKRAYGVVPSTLIGYWQPDKPLTRNVTAAIEELKKSKYWGKLDQYPIEYWWVAEVPWEERVALLFKSNMEQLGLKVDVVKKPWLSVVEALSKFETSPHIVSIFVATDYPEAGSMLSNRYHSRVQGTWQQNEWLNSTTIDQMIEDALSTLDLNARIQKYQAVQKYIFDLYPSIFVYEHVVVRAYQAYYVDFPAAKGKVPLMLGYEFDFRWIQVYPEKKTQPPS
ncbi:MAG: ABC transporter substrate-binding protein [Thermoproteota archaeon]|jgi:peptide/nickel transport system substrate-binding protein|nr:ABC transporter substrate-binding protein [Thermoproteota archaeon]